MSAWKPTRLGPADRFQQVDHLLPECMPPQQISPSAASRSPWSRRSSPASLEGLGDRLGVAVGVVRPVVDAGRPSRCGRRRTAGRRARGACWRCGRPCATCVEELLALLRRCPSPSRRRSAARPGRRPSRSPGPRAATLSARRFELVVARRRCRRAGRTRKRSTPSNLTPSTSAAAVRSSIVSRSIGGSESAPLADHARPHGVVQFSGSCSSPPCCFPLCRGRPIPPGAPPDPSARCVAASASSNAAKPSSPLG